MIHSLLLSTLGPVLLSSTAVSASKAYLSPTSSWV